MRFLSRMFGIGREPRSRSENLLTVAINARLNVHAIPEDRKYYYDDPLDRVLAEKGLGEVTGGGTMFDTGSGRIDYNVLEIGLQDSSDETFAVIIDALEQLGAPAGSYLEILPDKRKLPFGKYEGLSLALDRQGLRDPADPSGEVNGILSAIEAALGEAGAFRGYWEGDSACELYFYGPSFDEMRAAIATLARTDNRLADCAIAQIA